MRRKKATTRPCCARNSRFRFLFCALMSRVAACFDMAAGAFAMTSRSVGQRRVSDRHEEEKEGMRSRSRMVKQRREESVVR